MAINYSYPDIGSLSSDDLFTVLDASQSLVTRSVDLQTLASYIGSGSGGGAVTSLTTTGTSGVATLASGVLNIPNYTTNAGTVTDVQTTNGAGISTSVINSTSAPNITITNTDLGSSQNIFKNFAVSGQTTVAADSNNDTLTLVAGSNVTITTNATTDAITISAISDTTSFGNDIVVNGLTVGRGTGDNSTNTTFGVQALETNSSASAGDNVAIGRRALRTKGSGSFNTAVGASSMGAALVVGSYNTGLGFNSLNSLTSGSNNIGIGYFALGNNSTGGYNVAIGTSSMRNTTGTNAAGNVGVGGNSLYYLQDGEHNVAIGYSAGQGASNYTANDCIFIGERANPGGIGYTNQIVIGTTAAGKGANTAVIGNSSITELHVGGDGAGIVLKSPNGTAYKITVTDAGALVVT